MVYLDMYWKIINNYKRYKHKVLAVLYVAFLLAETGEFFVTTHHQKDHSATGREVSLMNEIPDHTPENSVAKINFHVLKCFNKYCLLFDEDTNNFLPESTLSATSLLTPHRQS